MDFRRAGFLPAISGDVEIRPAKNSCFLRGIAIDEETTRLAHILQAEMGTGLESVALVFETEAALFVVILGVLKAGRPFVYCEPTDPPARIETILSLSQPGFVLTSDRLRDQIHDYLPSGYRLVTLEWLLAREAPLLKLPLRGKSKIAYINFTSGSTGHPKGVITTHTEIVQHSDRWMHCFAITDQDRFALLRPALRLVFGALLAGAALHIWDYKRKGTLQLAGWLERQSITAFYSGPTILRHFLQGLMAPLALPHLRLVLESGEALYRSDVELYQKLFDPIPQLANLLMSRETGLIRCYYVDPKTPLETEVVPVGYAVDGVHVQLLDETGMPVSLGDVGEIAVQSESTFAGYWQEPELTRTRFGPDINGRPLYLTGDRGRMGPDNCLFFLGRKDSQLKIRGYRVKPEEIEEAIRRLAVAPDVAVAARKTESGETRLIGYLAMHGWPHPTVSFIRRQLAQSLPAYLIPSAFVVLDALPLNANSRLDRRALPLPTDSRPTLEISFVVPTTPIEHTLAAIWTEILGLDAVGIHDPFFDLGGNSLQAMRIAARVQDEFGVEMPLTELFAAGTVAEMALVVMVELASDTGMTELIDG
ncbi:MAG: non-ribosomal peptide synthetase [Caldilineaceae bacterium]|nr:non-ribosomal peptide synthetase [Caldilineaceae bacterium]